MLLNIDRQKSVRGKAALVKLTLSKSFNVRCSFFSKSAQEGNAPLPLTTVSFKSNRFEV